MRHSIRKRLRKSRSNEYERYVMRCDVEEAKGMSAIVQLERRVCTHCVSVLVDLR